VVFERLLSNSRLPAETLVWYKFTEKIPSDFTGCTVAMIRASSNAEPIVEGKTFIVDDTVRGGARTGSVGRQFFVANDPRSSWV
jgi:hypothetical protein